MAYSSLAPSVAAPVGIKVWDKFSHFAVYAILAVLLVRVLATLRTVRLRVLLGAWLGCFGYGLFLEGLQWAMALGRQFEAGDLFANGLGAMMGCAVFCRMLRR